MKLNVLAFGIASGVLWGASMFILTWWIIMFHGSSEEPTFIGQIYLRYTISPQGSIIGLIWGLVDGFIGGLLLAWLYNFVLDRVGGITTSKSKG